MTERKTLNRYYPVDYDPAKIPKLKQTDKDKNRLWGIRVMAPFNMRCNTCGDYIYKGKKFNSRKETVTTEDYLGIQIHRFYIRCPKCVAVIAFKTDPENCDYTLETGATRNFEAAKTLMDMEKKKQQAAEDEEAANPMKVLENRTKQSRNEMDMMESLTELRELNARHEKVDHEGMIKKAALYQKELERLQKEEEDRLVRELFGSAEEANGETIRRLDSDEEDDDEYPILKKQKTTPNSNCTDLLTSDSSSTDAKPHSQPPAPSKALPHKKPSTSKTLLSSLVKLKPANKSQTEDSGIADPNKTVSKNGVGTNGKPRSVKETEATISTGAEATNTHFLGTETASSVGAEAKPTGALGMLGAYSSSEADSD